MRRSRSPALSPTRLALRSVLGTPSPAAHERWNRRGGALAGLLLAEWERERTSRSPEHPDTTSAPLALSDLPPIARENAEDHPTA